MTTIHNLFDSDIARTDVGAALEFANWLDGAFRYCMECGEWELVEDRELTGGSDTIWNAAMSFVIDQYSHSRKEECEECATNARHFLSYTGLEAIVKLAEMNPELRVVRHAD